MDKLKMAACGVDCNVCGQYKVTAQQDMKAAEGLVDWYRSQGWIGKDEGAEVVMAKAPLCKGCWNTTDDCFFKCGCGSIDFRICCKERQISHCGECGEFPCKEYKEFASGPEHHKTAFNYLSSLRTKPKVALVTGAAGGIGLLTARRLIADGYTVWCVDRSPLV